MRRFIIIALIATCFSVSAQTKSVKNSPSLSEATPASAGMSGERLQRIDNMLNDAIRQNEIPGAVALIARNGKIIYHKAFGMADNGSMRTMKRDDIFRIASQTKAITATAVMMLWEEGKFGLDDPISNWIPEFSNVQVLDSLNEKTMNWTAHSASKPITIRHLLTHTSGIGYGVIDGDERFKKIYKQAGITDLFTTEKILIGDNIKKLVKLPLRHEPGEKFTYSESLDVLGYFVEIISGLTLDKFFNERIFVPLGMADTYFYLPKEKYGRIVTVQTKRGENWIKYPVQEAYDPDFPIKGAKTFFSGGAGLSSTAKDYAAFLQMYLNQGELGGVRLLSRTTVQFMMANQIGDLWGENSESYYGLAFGVMTQRGQDRGGRGSVGTFDWGGYFNTQYFADPQEKIIGILMKQTQGIQSDNTASKFRRLVFVAVDD